MTTVSSRPLLTWTSSTNECSPDAAISTSPRCSWARAATFTHETRAPNPEILNKDNVPDTTEQKLAQAQEKISQLEEAKGELQVEMKEVKDKKDAEQKALRSSIEVQLSTIDTWTNECNKLKKENQELLNVIDGLKKELAKARVQPALQSNEVQTHRQVAYTLNPKP
jgi:chromosome segregation ATPase